MRILIAEDDAVSRRVLETALRKWGHEVRAACDGRAALEAIQEEPPPLAILDWMMPEINGLEVCRQVRSRPDTESTYIILLTAKGRKEDRIAGLQSGADGYLTKPFDHGELHARLQVGQRILALQQKLAERVRELEDALSRVKLLGGLLPICGYCKKIRDDTNYWQQVEGYISSHSEARFSHGICPQCMESVVKPELARFQEGLKDDRHA